MAAKSLAGEWMKANGHKWVSCGPRKPEGDPKTATGKAVRGKRMKTLHSESYFKRWQREEKKQTVKSFVESNRNRDDHRCLFVRGAQPNVPACVVYLGKNISAARYMLLLTQGTPPSDGMQARHKCGNGHLSCVNPAHLEWGTPGDNIGDANIHRAMEGATVEDKCRAVDARTSK